MRIRSDVDVDEARRVYGLAATAATDLPPGPYGDTVRDGIGRGLARVAAENADDLTGSIGKDDER